MAATVVRPTGPPKSFTLRESPESVVLTTSKSERSGLESDNECCVGCEYERFPWGEYGLERGRNDEDCPSSTKTAGVMSTCGTSSLDIADDRPTILDVERVIEEAARLRRAYR